MNQQRITLLPEPQFVALQPQLARRMDCAAKLLTPANFTSFCDGAMRRLIADTLHHCGATEGSIWLLDEKGQHLVNAFDHGPDAARLVGFRQPLKSGIISMVFATHQPFLENQVFQNAMHASAADKLTGHRTNAMIAVPLFFASDCRGGYFRRSARAGGQGRRRLARFYRRALRPHAVHLRIAEPPH